MPPKTDPYATTGARVIDLVLIAFAVLVVVIVVLTAPQNRHHADRLRINRSLVFSGAAVKWVRSTSDTTPGTPGAASEAS